MTATLPVAASRPAAHRAPRPGRARPRRYALDTPAALRALLAGLVLLSLAWGAFGGWVATQHSSAADSLVAVNERLSVDARQMYQSIADADATITATFLASSQPQLAPLDRYQGDLAVASGDLAGLQAADGSQATRGALARLSAGLVAYNGYVNEAKTEYAMGYSLTGGSFLQVASEEAHLVLLPAANTVFTQENAALNGASGQATELPTVIAAIVLALITVFVLYRAQHWLTRRTNRLFSPGLVLASVLLAVSTIWLAAGFLGARSDLDGGIAHGSGPAQNLALASIGAQQIRGDAVLNVISRSGNASFQDDFTSMSTRLRTYLGDAATAQEAGSTGTASVAAARRDATTWFATNTQVYRLGSASDYAAERNLVVGAGTGNTTAGYSALEGDVSQAIVADQAVFDAAAAAGSNTLGPLAGVVIAASLLMAVGCAWAVSRRLAEYR